MNLEGPEGNLFPGSLARVTGWSKSRLDANAGSLVSSEAHCVSVFGTPAERPDRTVALAAMLAAADGARNAGSPDVLVTRHDGVLVIGATRFCPRALRIRFAMAAISSCGRHARNVAGARGRLPHWWKRTVNDEPVCHVGPHADRSAGLRFADRSEGGVALRLKVTPIAGSGLSADAAAAQAAGAILARARAQGIEGVEAQPDGHGTLDAWIPVAGTSGEVRRLLTPIELRVYRLDRDPVVRAPSSRTTSANERRRERTAPSPVGADESDGHGVGSPST